MTFTPPHTMRRISFLAALAALCLLSAVPAPQALAAAGTMTIHACGTPESPTGPAAGWAAVAPVGAFSESKVACTTDGTMTANNGASKFAAYAFFVGDGAVL